MIVHMRSPFLVLMALLPAVVACGGVEERSPAAPMRESAPAQSPEETMKEPQRDAAPDFTMTTFEGDRFSLAEQRGTPVVLNFWESW